MERVELVVYSDYLCPWCYNVSVRLHAVQRELGGRVGIHWRSYLLRPRPQRELDLERFRAYTQSWSRPAAEAGSGTFRAWTGEAGPPSHSVPPHLVAKAASALGHDAFERVHEGLLHAYFAESRDVTCEATLRAIWSEAGLPDDAFERVADPGLLEQIVREHNEAIGLGVTGVPAVVVAGRDAIVTGAQPLAVYRRWVERLLAA